MRSTNLRRKGHIRGKQDLASFFFASRAVLPLHRNGHPTQISRHFLSRFFVFVGLMAIWGATQLLAEGSDWTTKLKYQEMMEKNTFQVAVLSGVRLSYTGLTWSNAQIQTRFAPTLTTAEFGLEASVRMSSRGLLNQTLVAKFGLLKSESLIQDLTNGVALGTLTGTIWDFAYLFTWRDYQLRTAPHTGYSWSAAEVSVGPQVLIHQFTLRSEARGFTGTTLVPAQVQSLTAVRPGFVARLALSFSMGSGGAFWGPALTLSQTFGPPGILDPDPLIHDFSLQSTHFELSLRWGGVFGHTFSILRPDRPKD